MWFYHLPYPARALESLEEVVVSLEFQHLPAKVSLYKVRHPCDQGVGGIKTVTKEIVDLQDKIHFALVGELPGGDPYGLS
jgi:hypothetical protein